ncbi:MAG: hypothetical protein QOD28_464, partial [Acidobacteriota bacterium]|nr:hypothetical protein [Acidobacteriota bacterium]
MKTSVRNFGGVLIIAALVLNATGASACTVKTREGAGNGQSTRKTQPAQPSTQPSPLASPVSEGEGNLETKVSGEIKELAAGGYSSVRDAFVFVARDAQTYATLRQWHEQLPPLGADFFKANAVVAAYLGQRSSGGYGVQFTRGDA